MSRYIDSFWFRHGILFLALAAGGLMTLVVPSYEEMAAAHAEPAKSEIRKTANIDTSQGISGIDIDQRRLEMIRNIN